jgi:hypothetical protein
LKIQEKDFYYGAALAQLAAHPVFTSINKVTEKDGLYLVNGYKKVLIKYSSADGPEWKFTFRTEDSEVADGHELFFVLVCGASTICLLRESDIDQLLDLSTYKSQWISVTYPDGGQMRIKGSLGNLKNTVSHNSFPQDLLGSVAKKQEPYAWPPLSRLNFYEYPPGLILSSVNRILDFSDALGDKVVTDENTTIYFGLTTISHKSKTWSEKNLCTIEKAIKYDFEFDGFDVAIERFTSPIDPCTKKKNRPCDTQFVWRLEISTV